ncbi:isoaspartyl peptidase/L-asparaginase family protein [Qipengyuania sp. DSG2-2]|uniref:isoaspartyl peptidase/L-asparaginase family protein n=1 Tax=Qipengyuania sp. DGS2-2 TaxID=3349631 RepID=UPI0036D30ED9
MIGAVMALAAPATAQDMAVGDEPGWSFAIHGGAGVIERENLTDEQEAAYRAALDAALSAGTAILAEGGTAMEAIKAAIVLMEDDPLFNAGRGAVFTWDGRIEHDASIMDGTDRSAGAVTGTRTIRNPILLADTVRTESRHVFLSGDGAEEFAGEHAIETVLPDWFATERRLESLNRLKAQKLSALDVDVKYGTVGAVARDMQGNLAAGTSTGGMTGKRWGRIGDAPIIGAGTYADNDSCAVSATGHGEYFIRVGVAREICSRIALVGEDPQTASDTVLAEVLEMGGDGGVIVVTPAGDEVFSFNTAGMYRGRADSEGLREIAIFGDHAGDAE